MATWTGDRIELDLERVISTRVRVVGGELSVTAGDGPAHLDAEVLEGDDLEVTLSDGELSVRHGPEATISFGRTPRQRARVTLTVPATTEVRASGVNADLLVAGLSSGPTVSTVSGRATLSRVGGDVRITSVSASVDVDGVEGSLVCTTVSGAVTVVNGTLESLRVTSVSGDVIGDLDTAPQTTVTTVSGQFALRLPSDAAFDLEVSTASGRLNCEFALDGEQRGRRRLTGRVASGGPRVAVRTVSGRVALMGRPAERGVDRVPAGAEQ